MQEEDLLFVFTVNLHNLYIFRSESVGRRLLAIHDWCPHMNRNFLLMHAAATCPSLQGDNANLFHAVGTLSALLQDPT